MTRSFDAPRHLEMPNSTVNIWKSMHPGQVVFTEIFAHFPDTVSTEATDLIEKDGGLKTRMSAIITYPSMDVRDMVLATGMPRGAGIRCDRLEDLVVAMQL